MFHYRQFFIFNYSYIRSNKLCLPYSHFCSTLRSEVEEQHFELEPSRPLTTAANNAQSHPLTAEILFFTYARQYFASPHHLKGQLSSLLRRLTAHFHHSAGYSFASPNLRLATGVQLTAQEQVKRMHTFPPQHQPTIRTKVQL